MPLWFCGCLVAGLLWQCIIDAVTKYNRENRLNPEAMVLKSPIKLTLVRLRKKKTQINDIKNES